MLAYSLLLSSLNKYSFSIFCIPKNIFSDSYILVIFFEKLNIKKITINTVNFFFENSLKIKKSKKIKNTKVIKIYIANLNTGEKFNQKNKLTKEKNRSIFFLLNDKDIFFFLFFKNKKNNNSGITIVIECSNISFKLLLNQKGNHVKLFKYSSGG